MTYDYLAQIQDQYRKLRADAQAKASENAARARANESFRRNDNRLADIERELAFAEMAKNGNKVRSLEKEKADTLAANEKLLSSMGLTYADLSPVYRCAKCGDTGFIGTSPCSCYLKALETASAGKMGISPEKLPVIDETVASEKNLSHEFAKLLSFSAKFPEVRLKNVNLIGRTGTGKTLLAADTAARVAKRGYNVIFLTSFDLNNRFLEYHSLFSAERAALMNALVAADLLVIDDLGAEQLFRNVTAPYLLNLLSERNLKNVSTIITSNLSCDELRSRYGERVFSRIFDKRLSATISFGGRDDRLKTE